MRWMACLVLATVAVAHDDDISLAEAEKKMRARDYAGALADYDHVLEHDPDVAKAHAGRAWALQMLGRLDEALPAASRAIELAPSAAYYQQRGYIRLILGQADAALADFTKGIELEPKSSQLYRLRADAQRDRYEFAAAIVDYSRALDLDPMNLTALERRGQTKESLRDFEGAIEDYTTLANAAPSHPRPFSLRGNVELVLGKFKEAIGDYDAAVYNDPKDAHSYVGRARAKLALGDREGADADVVRGCEASTQAHAFAERGRYYFDSGRPKEAAADLAKAVQMEPKAQDYSRFFLFLARAKLGERDPATTELKAYVATRDAKDDWYGKIVAMLTGGMEEEAFLAAAKHENPNRAREQECEACWYAAAARLLKSDSAGAKPLLERCIATDVRNFIEYGSAKAALAAMSQ